MRVLLLILEGHEGTGGISQYNRDLIEALSNLDEVQSISILSKSPSLATNKLPKKVIYSIGGDGGKLRFIKNILMKLFTKYDLVICGHINLLPLAYLHKLRSNAKMALLAFGIDVWMPHSSKIIRKIIRTTDAIWAVSQYTQNQLVKWACVDEKRFFLLPNAIDTSKYQLLDRDKDLEIRHGIEEKKILMVIGRLAKEERYKGIDEVMGVMPTLLKLEPSLIYIVIGEGSDKNRLIQKSKDINLDKKIIFTGYINEWEKNKYLSLADVFVMPGRGEGFGFVYLEALAAGVPVVGSILDGSREALRGGTLGELVNPDDKNSLINGILAALNKKKIVPNGLEFFSIINYKKRLSSALKKVSIDK